jgi:hypothetical protein
MVFENRVLRRIFGFKGDKVPEEWRKLHNREFYDLHSSPNIVRFIKSRVKWATHVANMRNRTDAYRVLARRPDRKRPLVRPRI